jgi:hypothetical protein
VPACGWTDDLQLGYIYTGALNLVPYIYIYYILHYYPHIFIFWVYLSWHIIASQQIIKEIH